jgi:hypothetical protein
MLLGPEDGEQLGSPGMDGGKPMEPRVTGRADSDQNIGITIARLTMVDMKDAGVPVPAARTLKVIALKDDFPVSAEVVF